MKSRGFFVAGTDTDVGKTFVSCGLLHAFAERGLSTLGLKPIAAGCEVTPEGLRNADALALQSVATVPLPYEQVNPLALKEPMAPHLAAARDGKRLAVSTIVGRCRGALTTQHDIAIIEGAGGWLVPLERGRTMADLAAELAKPVILVVGMRLGCLNHALLTARAIQQQGLELAAWVANVCDPQMAALEDNMATLEGLFSAPLIGRIPRLASPTPASAARHLDIRKLLDGFEN